MDQKELREWEARCIQEEPPACRAGCPIAVDARGFSRAMAGNDLDGARAILDKSMPLPEIVGRLCEAPCEQYCIRKDLGGAIRVGRLERACVSASRSRGKVLRLPPRPKKAAVLGGGPSGLTVAYDLAKKGYPVTLYHLESGPGGWLGGLPEERLPAQVLADTIKKLTAFGVDMREVGAIDAALYAGLADDAVYVGQDVAISDDLLKFVVNHDPVTFGVATAGLFTGGLSPADHQFRLITDVAQGRDAALSMDRYLQGASLTSSRVAPRCGQTDLFTQTKDIAPIAPVEPSDPAGYSREEAVEEAARCIDCQCLECVRHCVYLAEYKAYPRVYVRRIYNNSSIVKGIHQANKFINTCALCRQCETLCPKDFSMADLCLESRQQMVMEQRMPPSAHWFALEEMRSVRRESALVRHNTDKNVSQTLFFPGCQLAGVRHDQTLWLYERLLDIEPETGIWLDCCGAPAHWAGRADEYDGVVAQLEKDWIDMGRPRVVFACSSCLLMFREHLPDIEAESVWNVLAGEDLTTVDPLPPLALSDPCTARNDAATRNSVRDILQSMGQPLAPLEMSGELTECCGYGGLQDTADPIVGRKVVEARVAQTDAVMLTYCAMCRDRLARTGKPVLHLLDLLDRSHAHSADEQPVSISARRVNRRRLRDALLTRLPASQLPPREPWEDLELDIPESVAAMLEERRILEDDIRRVLHGAGKQCGFAHGGADDRQLAFDTLGEVTFWVEYRQVGETYHILRCWSHRMHIKGV